MSLHEILKTAIWALNANKSRTALTILGIVIGIMSIIMIVSVGNGAQNLILNQIQGLGSNTIVVLPGREPAGVSDVAQIFSDSLKEKDLEAIKNKTNVPTLKNVIPVVFGVQTAAYGSERYQTTIFGSSPGITSILDIQPAEGEFFSDDDVRSNAEVIVIGAKVKEKLFGNSAALGEKIRVKDKNFRVIGILPKKGQVSFFNFDEMAILPYTTAQTYVLGFKHFNRFIVEADSAGVINQTVNDITVTIRSNHNITDPTKDDFYIQTQADLIKRVSVITNILTMFLTAVAAISLLVGGIGIMNIMLVSVTERTREIGLRKAIGAKNSDILKQFLFEAVILTVLGGVIGVILGILLSLVISIVISHFLGQSWPFSISLISVLLGVGVAAFVGVVFGIFPARRASQLNPIEALRYE